jgi:UPF0755 protein
VTNNRKKYFLFFLAWLVINSLLLAGVFVYSIHRESSCDGCDSVIVEYSENDDYIAELLVKNGVSDSPWLCKIAVRLLKNCGFRPRIGEYKLSQHISIMEAIRIFACGDAVIHKITISEGLAVVRVIKLLNDNEFLLGKIENIPEEGSLMPATYFFQYPTNRQQIIELAQRYMKQFIEREWPKRSNACMLKTPQEAIVLASIVEKETSCEREKIAGVFFNRLMKNMRLQSCPTVIYAITHGEPLGRKLTLTDLKTKSSYNTYRNNGLPPAPITNPGRESIIAVLHPELHDDMFFVLQDGKRHAFSKTFEEHKKKKAAIQKQLDR